MGGDVTVETRVIEGGLQISGELDMSSVDDFRKLAWSSIDPTHEVILDIADLEFLDSSGLKAIVRLADDACPRGLVLRRPRDNVLRVLEALRIEDVAGIRVERRTD
jgi:anti-anti-sigma factor